MAWRETADELFVRAVVTGGLLNHTDKVDSTGRTITILADPKLVEHLADACIEAGKIMERAKGRVR
tara:strand:- start:92 stop:289 length:198 start_codon:yes stop_codon:yes gene_type:complete